MVLLSLGERGQRVEALQDSDGNWVTEPDLVKNMDMNFFRDLYRDDSVNVPFQVRGCFPCLSHHEKVQLSSDFSFGEVRRALFDMGGLKAPGPDGYQALFFQSQWESIGQSIFKLVSKSFLNPIRLVRLMRPSFV